MSATHRHLETIAASLPGLAIGLTRHRQGPGPHWIMVGAVIEALREHGIGISDADLDAAIAIAVANDALKAVGDPVHSISPWQKHWDFG